MVQKARILVTESIVVLTPDVGRQQVVQESDGPPPWNIARDLQPLGVLVEHRIDDMNERFVAGKQTMPPGEQIPFEPSLAHVLAENLHHTAVRGNVIVAGEYFGG